MYDLILNSFGLKVKTDFNRRFSSPPTQGVELAVILIIRLLSSLVCSRGSCKRRLNMGTFCNKVLTYSVTPYYFMSIFHKIYLSIVQELRSFWYTIWLVTCDGLLQHLHQLLGFACAVTYKHVERVKPSYTAPLEVLTFEIRLTWETVFWKLAW